MKKTRFTPQNQLANSRGFLSADFLFGIVIASGLCALFFCLTFTLSMAEVGQYMAFSITRAHMAGHKDQEAQEAMAKAKFASFQKNKALAPLLTNGWFEIKNLVIRGGGPKGQDFGDRYPRGAAGEPNIPQTGIRLDFEAKILKGSIPMLGATGGNVEHKAFITGLMIREPSAQECLEQVRHQRYKAILSLDKRFEKIAGSASEKNYVPMEDNGC
jgi:hypothetical protein